MEELKFPKSIPTEYSEEQIEKILSRITPRPVLYSPANKMCSALYRYRNKIYNVEGLLYDALGISSDAISNGSWEKELER